MRLFVDANILFSAAYRDDSPADVLFRLTQAGYCELRTSALAIEEARRNIAVKRPERLPALESRAVRLTLSPEPQAAEVAHAARHGLPDKDAPILAAAIKCKADALVTGDRRHFGHLYGRSVSGVTVLGLADALERVIS